MYLSHTCVSQHHFHDHVYEQKNVKCVDEEDKTMCLANGVHIVASSVRFIEGLTPSYHSLMIVPYHFNFYVLSGTEKDVLRLYVSLVKMNCLY
jgi:hypothetical protein